MYSGASATSIVPLINLSAANKYILGSTIHFEYSPFPNNYYPTESTDYKVEAKPLHYLLVKSDISFAPRDNAIHPATFY